MTEQRCRRCGQQMKAVPIVKVGNRNVYGTNYYCPGRTCAYEVDTSER